MVRNHVPDKDNNAAKSTDGAAPNHVELTAVRAVRYDCLCPGIMHHSERCLEHNHELLVLERQRLGEDLIIEDDLEDWTGR